MPQTYRSRPEQGRLGCDRLPGALQPTHTFADLYRQPILARHIGMAALVALALCDSAGGEAWS